MYNVTHINQQYDLCAMMSHAEELSFQEVHAVWFGRKSTIWNIYILYKYSMCFLSIGRKSANYLGYIAQNFVNNLWGTGTCRLVAWDAMPLVAPSYMGRNMGKPGVNGDILKDIQPTIVGNMKWNRHRNNYVKLRLFFNILNAI